MQIGPRSIVLAAVLASAPASAVTSHIQVHTPELRLGALALRDVTVTVHDRGAGHETCVTATIGLARVDACGTIEVVRGEVMLRRGRATLTIAPQAGAGARLAATTVRAQVSGNLSHLDLALCGTVRTSRAELHAHLTTATFRDLELPFEVRVRRSGGELTIDERAPLEVHVGAATLAAAGATIPVVPTITLHAGWPHWRAEITWTGLALAPALAAASHGRVAGSGALAGELAFRGDRTTVTLARGYAFARGGELRLTDPALRDRLVAAIAGKIAIQHRVAAALADFTYQDLAITFGADPAVRIAIAGRGKRVAQDLDLTVNVRSQP